MKRLVNYIFNIVAVYVVIPLNKSDNAIIAVRFILLNLISFFSFNKLKELKFSWLLLFVWLIFGMNVYFLNTPKKTDTTSKRHKYLVPSKALSNFEKIHFFLDFTFQLSLTILLLKLFFVEIGIDNINYYYFGLMISMGYRFFSSYLFFTIFDKITKINILKIVKSIGSSDGMVSLITHTYEAIILFILTWFLLGTKMINTLSILTLISYSILGSLIPIISRFYFANGIISVYKLFINNQYKICVFRRFEVSNEIRTKILPILGAYGKIFSINDKSLISSKQEQYLQVSKDLMSETDEYIMVDNHQWRGVATDYIKKSNLIVLYWATEPTENMYWELNTSLNLRDKKNILLLLEPSISKNTINRLSLFIKSNALNQENIIMIDKRRRVLRKRIFEFIKL